MSSPRHLSPELFTLMLVPFIVSDKFTNRESSIHQNSEYRRFAPWSPIYELKTRPKWPFTRSKKHFSGGPKWAMLVQNMALGPTLRSCKCFTFSLCAKTRVENIAEHDIIASQFPRPSCEKPQPSQLAHLTR